MKRALVLILSTTLLAGSAAMAQEYRRDVPPQAPQDYRREMPQQTPQDYQRDRPQQERFQQRSDRGEHAWARGERVPVEMRARDHVVSDYRANHLRRPPAGYVWVRDRDRFLLVGKQTGRIAELAEVR